MRAEGRLPPRPVNTEAAQKAPDSLHTCPFVINQTQQSQPPEIWENGIPCFPPIISRYRPQPFVLLPHRADNASMARPLLVLILAGASLLPAQAPIIPIDELPENPLIVHLNYPCNLESRSCSTDFVLDMLPDDAKGTRRVWIIRLDSGVFADWETGTLIWPGVLDWSIRIWTGRSWEPEKNFISAPWKREMTLIAVNRPTRVRVTVKVADGWEPPTMDLPIRATSVIDQQR